MEPIFLFCLLLLTIETSQCRTVSKIDFQSLPSFLSSESAFQWKHHDNMELNKILQRVATDCAPIARLYELSDRSANGWPLTVLELSDNPGQHELCEYTHKQMDF